jgi:hypothetical protein
VTRDIVLTREADATLACLVAVLRAKTGARLNASTVSRAILRAVTRHIPAIEREAGRLPPMRLPSNAPGYEAEREAFETRIAQAILDGIRTH